MTKHEKRMASPGFNANLKGRWSYKHDECQHCQRTDRPHMAKGLCTICYNYHRDPAKAKAKRKRNRLEHDVVAKRYPKVRQWHVDHADHVKAYKKQWHKENGPKPKWPLGMTVWTKYAGFWCQGTIIETWAKPHRLKVRLLGGTELWTTGRYCKAQDPNVVAEGRVA